MLLNYIAVPGSGFECFGAFGPFPKGSEVRRLRMTVSGDMDPSNPVAVCYAGFTPVKQNKRPTAYADIGDFLRTGRPLVSELPGNGGLKTFGVVAPLLYCDVSSFQYWNGTLEVQSGRTRSVEAYLNTITGEADTWLSFFLQLQAGASPIANLSTIVLSLDARLP